MTAAQSRWTIVIMACCVYLGVRWFDDHTVSPLAHVMRKPMAFLIGLALLLAVLESLGGV